MAEALDQRVEAVSGVFGRVVYVLPFGVSRHSFELLLLSNLDGVHVVHLKASVFSVCLVSLARPLSGLASTIMPSSHPVDASPLMLLRVCKGAWDGLLISWVLA